MAQRGWDMLLFYGDTWRKEHFRCLVSVCFTGPQAAALLTKEGEVRAVRSDGAAWLGHAAVLWRYLAQRAFPLPSQRVLHGPASGRATYQRGRSARGQIGWRSVAGTCCCSMAIPGAKSISAA